MRKSPTFFEHNSSIIVINLFYPISDLLRPFSMRQRINWCIRTLYFSLSRFYTYRWVTVMWTQFWTQTKSLNVLFLGTFTFQHGARGIICESNHIKLFRFYVTFFYFESICSEEAGSIFFFSRFRTIPFEIQARLACRWATTTGRSNVFNGLNFVIPSVLFILHAKSEFKIQWMWHHTPTVKVTLAAERAMETHVHSNHFNRSQRNRSNLSHTHTQSFP